jgi:hypothetical protein
MALFIGRLPKGKFLMIEAQLFFILLMPALVL